MIPKEIVQRRIANISIGASVIRGQPQTTVSICRSYLESINLTEISNLTDLKFRNLIDRHTEEIKISIPSHSWGISRKVLNIFLFQACNDITLNQEYGLETIIPFLELPLDNPNAKRIKKINPDLKWDNVYSLTPEMSDKFQSTAKKISEEMGINRCQLDYFWWREKKSE